MNYRITYAGNLISCHNHPVKAGRDARNLAQAMGPGSVVVVTEVNNKGEVLKSWDFEYLPDWLDANRPSESHVIASQPPENDSPFDNLPFDSARSLTPGAMSS